MSKDENTLILGIGGVGLHLAQRLVHEGYPVTVIESDSELLEASAESLDARLICGNALQISFSTAHIQQSPRKLVKT